MELYSIEFKSSVKKDIKKLPKKIILQAFKKIEELKKQPFPVQAKKLQDCESLYRIRIGNYRVVYEIDENRMIITIYYIRHRKDVYRSL